MLCDKGMMNMKKSWMFYMMMLCAICTQSSANTDSLTGDLLYSDDFSDPASGWPRATTESYRMDYMNGMYHIYVNTSHTVKNVKVPAGIEFSDFVLETMVYVVDVPEYGEFGLNLRRENDDFYRLVLNTNHKFAFFKYKNGEWTDLIPWTRSDAVALDANRIKVIASGEDFTIYINDRWVGGCKDGSIRSGVVDVLGETQDSSQVHVAFDYLKIWSTSGAPGGVVPASRNVLTVGAGKEFPRIQDAINASADGDTIEVYSGTYRENILVDRKLTIHGIGTPVIDADRRGDGITISADGVAIEGLSVINARGGFLGYSGIMVYSSSNTIRNNSITLCDKGIELYEADSNLIDANIIEENDDNGMYLLSGCDGNTISGNRISRNGGDGIHIFESSRNLIFNNVIADNIGDDAYDDYNATERGTGDASRWDDGSRGNYYSDNPCTDSNRDGICDTPYGIPGGDSVDRYPLASPSVSVVRPPPEPPEGSRSATVSGAQSGSVSLGGAAVEIPPGSIPPNEDGTPGTMVISIEKTDMRPELSEGLSPAGEVYQLGPEGTVFERPVQIVLRIPEGVDPNTIVGVTTFNATSGRWELIPGTVDPDERTVTIFTDHFSPYALVSGADEWMRRNGGWIEIINRHRYNTPPEFIPCDGDGDRCALYPTHTEHGICIQNAVFGDASVAGFWTPPNNWMILAFDVPSGSTRSETRERFWVPAGTYTLTEFLFVSEVNPGDPMYSPCHHARARPAKVYRINPGDTLRFDHLDESSLIPGSTCFPGGYPCRSGVAAAASTGRTTAVHTGDIQVTLTWYANADIDLYVEDPNGDVVYYGNPQVPSGGELDRDNMCSNFEMGKPENIFWPTGGAPPGVYKVSVNYYSDCGGAGAVRWTVRTVVGGDVKTYTGVLNEEDETQEVTTFEIR